MIEREITNTEIGISYWFGYASLPNERIQIIKSSGFKSVALHWTNEYVDITGDKYIVLDKLIKNDISVSSFHLSFEDSHFLWSHSLNGDQYRTDIVKAISEATDYGISTIVIHSNGIACNDDVMKYLYPIALYAAEKKIVMCLENLPIEDNIKIIRSHDKLKHIPLCYDVGHNNIRKCPFDIHKNDDIKYIHIHDNSGLHDTHDIPFDGTVNWAEEIKVLRSYTSIPKILEVHSCLSNRDEAESFLRKANVVLNKLSLI